MKKQESVLRLLVRKNSKECTQAEKILRKNGAKFYVIDVEENDLIAHLWRDFGKDEVPILVSPFGTAVGVEKIIKFVKKQI